jgi:hypothetical protein
MEPSKQAYNLSINLHVDNAANVMCGTDYIGTAKDLFRARTRYRI